MTMDAAARRCLEALDEAGVDRAVVCGLSMGGYVAFALRNLAPERVIGLVLANTKAGADARPPQAVARWPSAARGGHRVPGGLAAAAAERRTRSRRLSSACAR